MENPVDQLQKSLNIQPQRNMSDKIFEQISRLIQSGQIPEGYVFPNESVLCEQLSVGRSTIREAYKALELSGYVTRTKRGTIVNSYATILEATPLKSVVAGTNDEHFMEYRLMLEGQAAALAADRATEEDIAQLQEIADAIISYSSGTDYDQIVALDRSFHEAIVSLSHNALMITSMAAIGEACEEKTREELSHVGALDEVLYRINKGHRDIVEAIRRHDYQAAMNQMLAHLTGLSPDLAAGDLKDGRAGLSPADQTDRPDDFQAASHENAQNDSKPFSLMNTIQRFLRKKSSN